MDRDYPAGPEHLTAYLDVRRKTLACDGSWPMSRGGSAFTSRPERRCVRAGNWGGDDEAIETEYALMAVEQGDPRPIPALFARVADKDDSLSLTILEVLIQHDLNLYQLRDAQQGFNLYLKRKPDDLYALLGAVGSGSAFRPIPMRSSIIAGLSPFIPITSPHIAGWRQHYCSWGLLPRLSSNIVGSTNACRTIRRFNSDWPSATANWAARQGPRVARWRTRERRTGPRRPCGNAVNWKSIANVPLMPNRGCVSRIKPRRSIAGSYSACLTASRRSAVRTPAR